MDKYTKFICALAVVLCITAQLKAQDSVTCNCARPDYHAPIGVMIDHGHKKGEWMLSYRLMDMNMQGNKMGAESISSAQVSQRYAMYANLMNMQMHMLMAMYGLTNKITLMAMVNYTYNTMSMGMTSTTMNMSGSGSTMVMTMTTNSMQSSSNAFGFGDTKLYVLYSLLNKPNHQILLSGGISIPTGSVNIKNNSAMTEMGESPKASYNMQTGTGTFGILPGVTYTGQCSSFSWGAQAVTDIKLGTNSAGYRLGNEYNLNLWLAHKWTNWISNSIRVNGDAVGKIVGYDQWLRDYGYSYDPTANTANYGGFRSSVLVGVNILPKGFMTGNQFSLEAGVPFYQNVNGIQMNTRLLVNAGWGYTF